MVVLGLLPRKIQVGGELDEGVVGEVTFPPFRKVNSGNVVRRVLATMVGRIGADCDPPDWDEVQAAEVGDPHALKLYCEYLGWDERDYGAATAAAWELAANRDFTQLETVFTTVLEYKPVLHIGDIASLVALALGPKRLGELIDKEAQT
jgi:hypothetical protein